MNSMYCTCSRAARLMTVATASATWLWEATKVEALARKMAREWEVLAKDGDHYKLAFEAPGTWSQKYNLVWDQLLELNLFDPNVKRIDLSFYAHHINKYGLPLDNRKDYTKLDWEIG